MSFNYYRQKKFRALKRFGDTKECSNTVNNNKNSNCVENMDTNVIPHSSRLDISDSDYVNSNSNSVETVNDSNSDNYFDSNCKSDRDSADNNDDPHEEVNSVSNPTTKIHQWTLNNLDSLRLNVVTDLLKILRDEGHLSLPTTAQKLLGTKHHRILQQMKTNKNNEGQYIYIGIEHCLKQIINADIFKEREIVLVHIDGMQLYNNSVMQVWLITVKIFHKDYNCKPFAVALYCGDSKPANAYDYLIDFVKEASKLINKGLIIGTKKYLFRILAIIADSPARSFIKCIKPPGSFYACERCLVTGISIGKKLQKKKNIPRNKLFQPHKGIF